MRRVITVKPVLRGYIGDKELEAQWAEPVLLTFHSALENLIQNLPTKFHFILAKQFQRRRFLEMDQSEARIACGGHAC